MMGEEPRGRSDIFQSRARVLVTYAAGVARKYSEIR